MSETTEWKELDLEKKVTVRSIAPWTTGFQRIESNGDVTIPPEGTTRIARSEIISQVQNGNRLFCGTDNRGSHATLYIDDDATRVEVEFDSPEEKRTQVVITPEIVQNLFNYKTMKTFEEKLKEYVVTRAEKCAILQIIKKEKLNDFEKIRMIENYTGYKL